MMTRSLLLGIVILSCIVVAYGDKINDVAKARHDIDKDRCTALLIGRKASADGSVMTTHNNDCTDCDFRLTRIPAKDHPKGSLRPVIGVRFLYPRYVGSDRGDLFLSSNLDTSVASWEESQPIGYIPQVKHTYSYLEGSYAIINEKQVAIGESTCDARLVAKPIHGGGAALFDVGELARIALERASTAREAIKIMGELAYEYGYYGSEWEGEGASEEAGEALTVTDPNEAWHFHVMPDDTGRRAIWVAQRVPDHHVSYVTNYFVIRQINLDDTKNFLASPNVMSVAKKLGFWDGVSPFDFALAYGTKRYSNPVPEEFQNFAHRGWRITSAWSPSLNVSTKMGHLDFPFSFRPDHLISLNDVMAMNRDTFAGTELDLSLGLAAGPWHTPTRYDGTTQFMDGVSFERLRAGHFERAISLHRTMYSYVTQSRAWLPNEIGARLWFAPHQPHTSLFVPFYTGGEVAPTFQTGHLYSLDRKSAWWAFAATANYAEKQYMWIARDIHQASDEMEQKSLVTLVQIEEEALQQYNGGKGASQAAAHVANWARDNAEYSTTAWWGLFDRLIAKYRDGQRIDCAHSKNFFSTSLFYPLSWLQSVGYWDGVPSVSIPKIATDAPIVTANVDTTLPSSDAINVNNNGGMMVGFIGGVLCTIAVGVMVSVTTKMCSRKYEGYQVIA